MSALLLLAALLLAASCGGCGRSAPRAPTRPPGSQAPGPWYCAFLTCPAGGLVTSRCSPTSCRGCCDASGACQTGTSPASCGRGGLACASCSPGLCIDGQCLTQPGLCGPGACSGCCQGATCLPGVQASQCGVGGAPCQACQGDQSCVSGRCRSSPGPTPTGCNPQTCTGCCDDLGRCQTANDDARCGRGGWLCAVCRSDQQCALSGVCVHRPTCARCRPGECCLDGACVPSASRRCATSSDPNAACRLCAAPEVCGGGSERGFCVRPGPGGLGSRCRWDGDCAVLSDGGSPRCLTTAEFGGLCSDDCAAVGAACAATGVCRSPGVCLATCADGGLACPSSGAVCQPLLGAPEATACAPRCNPFLPIQCPDAGCRLDGRCCGAPGLPCCDQGEACPGARSDGGALACGDDGACR